MKHEAPRIGDMVFIVSSVDNEAKPELGVGLVLELSSSIPNGIGYTDIKRTCTLLWQGELEKDIDIEWVKTVE